MAKAARSRRLIIAGAVAGIGVLGIGVAGAVTGGDSTPGPDPAAGDHPNAQAWETIPSAVDGPTTGHTTGANSAGEAAGTPGVGVAPSSDSLSTALTHTEGTPGNTVLNDLLTTAPGADRGAAIASDAKDFASTLTPPTPSLPEAGQQGLSNKL